LKPVYSNSNTLVLDVGGVAAGDHVLAPVTTNPIVAGFRPNDIVQLVNTPKASTPRAEHATIIDVTSTAVLLRRLLQSFDAGARFGMNPVPIGRFVGQDVELDNAVGVTNNFSSPMFDPMLNRSGGDFAADNALPSGTLLAAIDYSLLNTHAQTGTEFGSGATGNNRSLRFTCRTIAVGVPQLGNMGKVPGLIAYPGTPAFYPHDYGRERFGTTRDYVSFRFTAASTRSFMFGPTPV